MKRLIIDRVEGKYAICEDKDKRSFAIEVQELPEDAVPGAVLDISDEGELTVNKEETQRRKDRILEKQRKAFQA
jgi:hypothetical protein